MKLVKVNQEFYNDLRYNLRKMYKMLLNDKIWSFDVYKDNFIWYIIECYYQLKMKIIRLKYDFKN